MNITCPKASMGKNSHNSYSNAKYENFLHIYMKIFPMMCYIFHLEFINAHIFEF
jgi:hypothetical protein